MPNRVLVRTGLLYVACTTSLTSRSHHHNHHRRRHLPSLLFPLLLTRITLSLPQQPNLKLGAYLSFRL